MSNTLEKVSRNNPNDFYYEDEDFYINNIGKCFYKNKFVGTLFLNTVNRKYLVMFNGGVISQGLSFKIYSALNQLNKE